ncbi:MULTISPECIES: hypothetical protein [unclassified Pantoea]|uniref:hypothetical protein n=1 Tax=unclassified Pantoea TaxID=2630326 RepID=UPI000D752DB4|nr:MULTISPECIES: hypothetical protein [unclassified Pantoea]KAA6001445.1 hypothetical protein F3I50_03625 [Pantoea sp. M_5]MCJ7926495.1 hypothetical protein [Pantoea vagans]PXW19040.1 hypothetical protein BY447_0607 [Pantoea sp. JKS000250]
MIVLFIPSLISLLVSKAEEKGSPLTEEEVLAIRDNATAIVTDAEGVLAVAERRGYQDIDPEHCWEEWLDFNKQD